MTPIQQACERNEGTHLIAVRKLASLPKISYYYSTLLFEDSAVSMPRHSNSESACLTGRTPPSRYLYSTDTYTVQSLESQDTRFVVFGGASKHKCYLDDLWVYSVSENMWSEKSKLSPGQPHRCRYLNN